MVAVIATNLNSLRHRRCVKMRNFMILFFTFITTQVRLSSSQSRQVTPEEGFPPFRHLQEVNDEDTCKSCCDAADELDLFLKTDKAKNCRKRGCQDKDCSDFPCEVGRLFTLGLPSDERQDRNGENVSYICLSTGEVELVTSPLPTRNPTPAPTLFPTPRPTMAPTLFPSNFPTPVPTPSPTKYPNILPTMSPTQSPVNSTMAPSQESAEIEYPLVNSVLSQMNTPSGFIVGTGVVFSGGCLYGAMLALCCCVAPKKEKRKVQKPKAKIVEEDSKSLIMATDTSTTDWDTKAKRFNWLDSVFEGRRSWYRSANGRRSWYRRSSRSRSEASVTDAATMAANYPEEYVDSNDDTDDNDSTPLDIRMFYPEEDNSKNDSI
mmetsp:Transcript_16780/g.20320  ORF Transcript_16780/g.20320 Transcript_16780/m.20320 type:complete len:377 (-) Transcript_16780:1077-2207(-)